MFFSEMTTSNSSSQLKQSSNEQNEKSPEPTIHFKITLWLISLPPETLVKWIIQTMEWIIQIIAGSTTALLQ